MDTDKTANKQYGHLKEHQFKKGQSGNPNGRPKGSRSIPDMLLKIGSEDGTKDGQYTKLEVVLRRVFEYALDGKSWAVEFIADRTEGKVRQELQVGMLPDVVFTPIDDVTEEEWNEKILESNNKQLPAPKEIN
tara:strand:- start:81 stop:479 length:399 start_codon:yes stop_codon:yes gene_type:complete